METLDKRDITDAVRAKRTFSEGITVIAKTVPDWFSKPSGFDCYGPVQIKAWHEDRWNYVGIVVEIHGPGGTVIGEASVFGFESGYFPSDEGTSTFLDPMTDEFTAIDIALEALDDAKNTLNNIKSLTIG